MAQEKMSLNDRVLQVASKIQQNPYIKAVSFGLASLMPIIIVGSLLTIVDSLGIPAYQKFLVDIGIKPFLKYPNMVTNGLLSVYAAFSIAYNLADARKQDGYMAGLLSIMAFMIVQPFETVKSLDVLPVHLLGAEGVFTAIVVAMIVPNVMKFLTKHNFYIKMPAGVPEMIERGFAALTTGGSVLLGFLIIKIIFAKTSIETLPNLIAIVIQTPLKALGSSWIALVIIMAIVNFLWFFGIHGHLVALSVMTPVYLQMDIENLNAYQAGKALPNIIGNSYIFIYASGACVLFGLVFWLWRARSERYRSLSRLAAVPMLFGIGEPLAFGVPYVLNFTLFIPVVFSASINAILAYIATVIHILPRLNGVNISGVPVGVGGFLVGGWRVALFQIALCLLNVVIWAPFVKRLDKTEYANELAHQQEAN
ncbi:MAG: PTS transporter subunit EIIC [Schleiferilactobacillus harbinensis]|nr:PTS transporter subunit EIIC [Schleiferilactobacillus harbinensis]MCI1912108.1 PTS transporter subunit EIIC [Schleiferilactobacillus harbinensis]